MQKRTVKSISSLKEAHKIFKYPLISSRQGRERTEMRSFLNFGRSVASQVRSLLSKDQSKRNVFIFPLTSATSAGDFYKGALSVFAPNSKVIYLRTPSVNNIPTTPSQIPLEQIQLVKKQLSRAKVSPNDNLIVVDFFDKMRTSGLIDESSKQLGLKPAKIKEISDVHTLLNVYYGIHSSQGLLKSAEGKIMITKNVYSNRQRKIAMAVGRAFALKILKNKK